MGDLPKMDIFDLLPHQESRLLAQSRESHLCLWSKHVPQFGENDLLSCLEQIQVLDWVENPGLGGENRLDFR